MAAKLKPIRRLIDGQHYICKPIRPRKLKKKQQLSFLLGV